MFNVQSHEMLLICMYNMTKKRSRRDIATKWNWFDIDTSALFQYIIKVNQICLILISSGVSYIGKKTLTFTKSVLYFSLGVIYHYYSFAF